MSSHRHHSTAWHLLWSYRRCEWHDGQLQVNYLLVVAYNSSPISCILSPVSCLLSPDFLSSSAPTSPTRLLAGCRPADTDRSHTATCWSHWHSGDTPLYTWCVCSVYSLQCLQSAVSTVCSIYSLQCLQSAVSNRRQCLQCPVDVLIAI